MRNVDVRVSLRTSRPRPSHRFRFSSLNRSSKTQTLSRFFPTAQKCFNTSVSIVKRLQLRLLFTPRVRRKISCRHAALRVAARISECLFLCLIGRLQRLQSRREQLLISVTDRRLLFKLQTFPSVLRGCRHRRTNLVVHSTRLKHELSPSLVLPCSCVSALQLKPRGDAVCTFAVLRGGADVHPLLTLAAAHQEASHRLSGQEGVRLRYLRERTETERKRMFSQTLHRVSEIRENASTCRYVSSVSVIVCSGNKDGRSKL